MPRLFDPLAIDPLTLDTRIVPAPYTNDIYGCSRRPTTVCPRSPHVNISQGCGVA
ncbi:MAG: hypothetical protein IH939_00855 [Acidobacteria bacterium]|nr:hypothetical protein [Acidobacteriota bacterium]